jgi:hypothetical protein
LKWGSTKAARYRRATATARGHPSRLSTARIRCASSSRMLRGARTTPWCAAATEAALCLYRLRPNGMRVPTALRCHASDTAAASSSSSSSFSSYSASSDRADVAPSSGIERRLNTYRETQRTRRAVPEGAPHHPRVSIPRSLSDHLIRARPFSAPLEPITPEDAATMLRQTRKVLACASSCRLSTTLYPEPRTSNPINP